MNATVVVDGQGFALLSGNEQGGIMRIRGKRGGEYTLVRNIKHGYWVMLNGSVKPKERHVRRVEVTSP